jgi:hypothetical protein
MRRTSIHNVCRGEFDLKWGYRSRGTQQIEHEIESCKSEPGSTRAQGGSLKALSQLTRDCDWLSGEPRNERLRPSVIKAR